MPSDVQLDVVAKLDRIERQLKSLFGKPIQLQVTVDPSSVLKTRRLLQVTLDATPIRLSNVTFASSATRGIRTSLQKSFNAAPLFINKVQLSRGAINDLRKQVQSAMSGVPIRSTSGFGGPGKGRGGFGLALPLGKITGDVTEFGRSIDAAAARVTAFGGIAASIYLVARSFNELVTSTLDVDKALREINVLLNLTDRDLQKFGADLFAISRQTATGFDAASAAALEFSRQGLSVEETLKGTQAALILTRISGLDSAKAVDALTTAYNSFNKEGLERLEITDKLAAVDAVAATSAGGLAEGVSRVGSAAADAGVSFDELLGLIASAKQITGRSEAVIGNAFKTIFTRLDRTKVREVLGGVIDIKDSDSAVQILQKLAKNYDSLSKTQQAYVAEITAGVFQINQFKAVISDLGSEFSIYDRAVTAAGDSAGIATKRNAELTQSLKDLITIAGTNLKEGFAGIGNIGFADTGRDALGGFNKVADTVRNSFQNVSNGSATDFEKFGVIIGEGVIKGIASVLTGPGYVLLLGIVGKFLLQLGQFSKSNLKELLGVNRAVVERAELEKRVLEVLSRQKKITASLLKGRISESTVVSDLITKTDILAKKEQRRYELLQKVTKEAEKQGLRSVGGAFSTQGRPGFGSKLKGFGRAAIDPFNLAFAASIGAESVAGSFSDQTKGGRGGAAVASGVGSIASSALVGSLFGPIGIAIGAATGAFLSIPKVIDGFTSDVPDFQRALDGATKAFNEFSTLTQTVLSLQSNYDDLNQNVENGSASQKQLNKAQQKLSREVAKLPTEIRNKFLKAATFDEKQSILNSRVEKEQKNVSNSQSALSIVGALQGEKTVQFYSTVGSALLQITEDLKSVFTREDGKQNAIDIVRGLGGGFEGDYSPQLSENLAKLGKSLAQDSGASSSEEFFELAKSVRNTSELIEKAGIDINSGLGRSITELDKNPLKIRDVINAFREEALKLSKGTKEVAGALEKLAKETLDINLTEGAFFRGKTANEALAELTKSGDSTFTNRRNLDILPQAIAGDPNALKNALGRNEAIRGNVNDLKQQLKLSGLDPASQKELLKQAFNEQGLSDELLRNNRVITGGITSNRASNIISNAPGIGGQGLQQQIDAAIQAAVQSGDPQKVVDVISKLQTGIGSASPSQRDDIQALTSALTVFVESLKQNKQAVGAALDVAGFVEEKIENAKIDIASATINFDKINTTSPLTQSPFGPIQSISAPVEPLISPLANFRNLNTPTQGAENGSLTQLTVPVNISIQTQEDQDKADELSERIRQFVNQTTKEIYGERISDLERKTNTVPKPRPYLFPATR